MKKTLALIQMNVVAGDVEHNYKHVVELLDEAMQSIPDIIAVSNPCFQAKLIILIFPNISVDIKLTSLII